MKPEPMALENFLREALTEDIGSGDITTMSCVPAEKRILGRVVAKEDFIVCGLEIFSRVFSLLDERAKVHLLAEEGSCVSKGALLATLEGPAAAILSGERVALNLLQRLSGIATRTSEAVRQVRGTRARITDTRKTTPGLRALEKYAVRVGGGSNHRLGLSDGVLIKDNHIAAAGGITQAVRAARENIPHTLKIEVECETQAQVHEALSAGADIIMLDNMTCESMAEAVTLVGGRALTEASGNMGDKDLRAVAETGVDLISVGALTHTVRACDISVKLDMAD